MAKELWSIFTDNMNVCIFTGSGQVERHHCFPGFNRDKCETYGFVAPLRPDYHPNGVHGTDYARREIDPWLKAECQKYYEKHYGTRDEFVAEFGRNYITENDDHDWWDLQEDI